MKQHQSAKPSDAGSGDANSRSTPPARESLDTASQNETPQFSPILLVEDDPNDVFIVDRAFHEVGISIPRLVVRDGKEALEYLGGEGQFADRRQFPIPQLILLDIHMPFVDGFEVLTWLREQPHLRHLPVVVLTTSAYSPDVRRAYQLGANTFLTKPTDFTQLVSEVAAMCDFWLECPNPRTSAAYRAPITL